MKRIWIVLLALLCSAAVLFAAPQAFAAEQVDLVLDNCDTAENAAVRYTDPNNRVEGTACIRSLRSYEPKIELNFGEKTLAVAPQEDPYLSFYLFLENKTGLLPGCEVRLPSGEGWYQFQLNTAELREGWNAVVLDFADAGTIGEVKSGSVSGFSVFIKKDKNVALSDSYIKVDYIVMSNVRPPISTDSIEVLTDTVGNMAEAPIGSYQKPARFVGTAGFYVLVIGLPLLVAAGAIAAVLLLMKKRGEKHEN